MSNLYWPVYRNLEKELIGLADLVHLDDSQLKIYSVRIADLLIRCAVEIESISKDLYLREGGVVPEDRDLYFDTDCLKHLEDKWILSKKVVNLSSISFHLEKPKNRSITPLLKSYKRGTSGSLWKRAYQAVKHERVKNLKKGNIGNLINALAALYILNLYFKEESWDLEKDHNASDFSLGCGSNQFSIKLHKWKGYSGDGVYSKHEDFDECVYLNQWKQESQDAVIEANKKMNEEIGKSLVASPKYFEWLSNNDIASYSGSNLALDVLGQDAYHNLMRQHLSGLKKPYNSLEYEAVLNTNTI
jgi:hypothetical protein